MLQCATIFLGGPAAVLPLASTVTTTQKRKPGRPRKDQSMSPSTETTTETPKGNPVTRTVFDLASFDDVKLSKPFNPPSAPTTLEEALAAVGNDTSKLLSVIHEGLISEARQNAYDAIDGFFIVTEDGVSDTPYTGKFADDEKGKLINNAILALAKINGYEKSLAPEKKKALKDKAISFLRDNPAMLASLQG